MSKALRARRSRCDRATQYADVDGDVGWAKRSVPTRSVQATRRAIAGFDSVGTRRCAALCPPYDYRHTLPCGEGCNIAPRPGNAIISQIYQTTAGLIAIAMKTYEGKRTI